MSRWHTIVLPLALAGVSCADRGGPEESASNAVSGEQEAKQRAEREKALELARIQAEHRACRAMRKNIDTIPALAGTPVLDEQRHRVFGSAKGWPVVFRRKPVRDLASLQPYFRSLAESMQDPRRLYATLKKLRGLARFHREQVRAILLPEGYFYADEPRLARWMVIRFDLARFFNEDQIWLMRGSAIHRLVKSKRGYRYADGPNEGKLASLLLFDRVATKREALFPTLHVDFIPSARISGFDRVRLERITSVGINAKIRYGAKGPWVDAVFTNAEGKANLACEIIDVDQRDAVKAHRDFHHVHASAAQKLRRAAEAQADERLMFDEPREEEGQQDGSLRPQWLWAYNHGGEGYSFNKVWYPVFDRKGRPHPPQVCIDFVLDTYERASGTWFGGKDAPRRRIKGSIDFETYEMPNRRSVEAVANYFRENPGTFEIWDLGPEQRIRFIQRDEFFDFLRDNADRFRVNDVVLIHGPRGGEAHYHSFIVSRTDPITGMPVEVMENAGKPRFRSWQAAMRSGPLRSIKHVMVPSTEWLRDVFTKHAETVARAGPPTAPDVVPETTSKP